MLDHLSRALTSFQSSQDAFRVLCTLPHNGSDAGPRPLRQPQSVRNLVVLDSSFNPPTTAHAQMARSALEATGTEGSRLMLLLAVNNADKAPKPASFPLRLAMMEAFGRELLGELRGQGKDGASHEQEDGLQIDLAVTTMPYFHDKSLAVTESGFYGTPQPTQIFLAGFDTLVRIFNAKYYKEGILSALDPFLTERARLRITARPDDAWGSREEQAAYVRGLGQGALEQMGGRAEWAERVELVDGGEGGVSSSKARETVRAGRTEELDRLVGREVREWIEREKLYRDGE